MFPLVLYLSVICPNVSQATRLTLGWLGHVDFFVHFYNVCFFFVMLALIDSVSGTPVTNIGAGPTSEKDTWIAFNETKIADL